MTGPYGWDEYWDNPAWSRMVSDYGVNKVVAWSIDSQFPIPNPASRASLTRNVNPDRHARIRQKHFRHAERTIRMGYAWDQALERINNACGGHGDHSGELRVYEMQEAASAAFDACDWGTR